MELHGSRSTNLPMPTHSYSSEDSANERYRTSAQLPTLLQGRRIFDLNGVSDLSIVLPENLPSQHDMKGSFDFAQSEPIESVSGSGIGGSGVGQTSKLLPSIVRFFCFRLSDSFASLIAVLDHTIRDWWSITSSSAYLADTDGRRQCWQYTVLPLLVGSGIFNQLSFSDRSRGNTDLAAEIIAHSVLLIFSYLLALTLSRRNLWPDFMLVSALLMSTFLPILFSKGDDLIASSECQSPVLPVIFLAPLFCSVGVHAIAVGCGSLAAVIAYAFMVPANSRIIFISLSFASFCILAVIVCLLEHYAARAFSLQLASRQIVDNCADGILKISLESGIVSESCAGTEHHFGQVDDSIFSQVLPRCSDKKLFDDFLVAAAGGDFRSIVVTCQSKASDPQPFAWPPCSSEFEAKLVPVTYLRGEVMLCFQVQGHHSSRDRKNVRYSESSLPSDALAYASSTAHGRFGWDLSARLGRRRSSEQSRFGRRRSSEQMSTLSEISISEAQENICESPSFMSNFFMKPSSRRSSRRPSSHSLVSMWTCSRRTSVSGVGFGSRRSSIQEQEYINPAFNPANSFLGCNMLSPSKCGKRSHRAPKKETTNFRIPVHGSISNLHGSASSQGTNSPLSFSESETESFVSASASPRKAFVPSISVKSAPVGAFTRAERTLSAPMCAPAEVDAVIDLTCPSITSNTPPSNHSSNSREGKIVPSIETASKEENFEGTVDPVVPFASDSVISTSSTSNSSPIGSSGSKGIQLFSGARAFPRDEVGEEHAEGSVISGPSSLIDCSSQTEAFSAQCIHCSRPPLPPSTLLEPPSTPGPGRRRQSSTKAASLRSLLKKTWARPVSPVDLPLQLPLFLATPTKSKHFSIELVLSCWNNGRSDSICCSWHAAIDALRAVADELAGSCRKEWVPFHGVQCQECHCVVEEDEPYCLICSAPVLVDEVESRRTSLLSAGTSRTSMSPMPRYPLSPVVPPHQGSDSSSSRRSSSEETSMFNSENCTNVE